MVRSKQRAWPRRRSTRDQHQGRRRDRYPGWWTAIPYDEEDPYLRKEYEETLAGVGAKTEMEDWLYTKPKPGEVRPMANFMSGM